VGNTTEDYVELADVLAARYADAFERRGPGVLAAIAGGQGAGKSTLARLVVAALERRRLSAFTGSLDDFYLTRAERIDLGRRAHPLLVTRGVPGTHDVRLLESTIDALLVGQVRVPVFDKGDDDRAPWSAWRVVEASPHVIVLEGWCLGARPQPPAALVQPVNALEADEDRDGRFRRYVNDALAGDYARLAARFDHLTFLAVPDIDAVRRWRTEQELALSFERRMSVAALQRFIDHYERITRWMLRDMPTRVDLTVALGDRHDVKRLAFRPE